MNRRKVDWDPEKYNLAESAFVSKITDIMRNHLIETNLRS